MNIDDESTILTISNGVPVNGDILRNDYSYGELYTDVDREELFSGQIVVLEDGSVTIQTLTGENLGELQTSIVENGAPLTALAFEKGLFCLPVVNISLPFV